MVSKFLSSCFKILAGDTHAFIATGGYDLRQVIIAFKQEQHLDTLFIVSDGRLGSHLGFHGVKMCQFLFCVICGVMQVVC